MSARSYLRSLVVLAVALSSADCKKSLKTPPVAKVPAAVAGYTSGTVSREAVIRVQFTEAVVEPGQVGAALDKSPFSTSPSVDGMTVWSDRQTLELRPSKPLEPGRVYVVELPLDRLMTVASGAKKLEFGFTVMRQSIDVRRDGLEADGDAGEQRFRGVVATADVAEAAEVEKVVGASFDGKSLEATWTHSDDRRTHAFTFGGIVRSEANKELVVKWTGAPVGAEQKGEDKVKVPGLATFAVASVRAVNGDEQYLEVRFTDPLERKQSLSGLVRAGDDKHLRTVIDGSVLRVYGRARFGENVALTLEPGIKNFRGFAMKERYAETVAFAPLTPAVRFGSKGVFVPTTDGLTIPIETANLKAIIVEAVRVPEQNIPQFLQVNAFDGSNEMHRVGRVVWKQVVDLGAGADKKNRWARYGLDMKPLIAKNPGGLYRIKLTFRRQHLLVDCPDVKPSEDGAELATHDDDWGNQRDESAWDYAEETGGEYYNAYETRNDPCSPSFYRQYSGHTVAVTRNVLVTDVGLIAKVGGDNSVFVAATDLKTAEPLKGVEVRVLDFQQLELARGTTDADGTLRLAVDHRPFVVVAKNGDQHGYVKLDDGSALALSHFDVSGAAVTRGIKGKLYGERGVWRPGDDIFTTFVLYDPDGHIPSDHPVRFELVDPQGRMVDSQVRREGVGGFYAFRTRTAGDAPTGNYTARVRVGGTTFEEQLKVEMVRPNRLKIAVDFHTDMIKAQDEVEGKLSSTWLHGAIARNLKADVAVTLQPRGTRFARFADYAFDDPVRRFEPESQTLFEGNLDDNGEASVTGRLAAQGQAPGMLTASFATRVFESGGAYSSDTFSVPFSPYPRYIGIQPPKGDAARGMLLTDIKHELRVVAVGPDGEKARGDVSVECKLYKLDWRWWWDKGEDSSLASYVEARGHTALASGTVKLKDGEGAWQFETKYPDWGRYLLIARDTKGGHRTGRIVYMDWPGWAGRAQKDNPGGASVLAFAADKQEYAVGETVKLTIPTAEKGRGLVSIESGSKVLQAAWIEAKGGGETHYELKVTPEMAPNVFVHVTLVQPHLTTKNDLPIRLYGVIPIKVVDPDTRLTPVLEVPEVFAPESKGTITVSEAKGRPMTYTVAVVDEGLLGLTRFGTPNLWDTFFKREALGVKTWDIYELVAGAYGASLERLLAIGGDDSGQAEGGRKANRFPPVVRFMGPFTLDGGKATHAVDMPRYVGAVRVMVVAGSKRAFGSAEKSVFVRKPLLVLATLPRVLGPEEELDLPVTVFALEDKVKKATVRVSASGPVAVEGSSAESVSFKGPGDRTIAFGLKAKPETGVAKIDVVVEGGGEKVTQTIEIDVRMPGVRVTDVAAGVVEPGQKWAGEVPLPGYAGTNVATLEVSRVPPLDLGRRLDYLIHYPYGCVEQTTSSVFPQLYLSSLLDLPTGRKAEIETNVKAGIDRLRMFQTASGGFSYWPGEGQPDDWASNYAGNFLAEARKAGYLVQDAVLEQWKRYQRNRANGFSPSEGAHHGRPQTELDQAYRLYTLALAGAPELGAMNRLKESGKLPVAALWQLAATYQLAGKPEVAQELSRGAALTVPKYRELAYTYGSDLRDRAIIVETLGLMKDYARGLPVVKELSTSLSSKEWLSTQEIAYSLVAVARFVEATKGDDVSKASYSLAGGAAKALESKAPVLQEKLGIGKADKAALSVTNTGSKPLFVRAIGVGLPRYETEQAAENGLGLTVTYKTLTGESVDVSSLEQGADFVAEVVVRNTSGRKLDNLALSSLVASGWEIRNQRVEGGQAPGQSALDYQDIRDDRVFTFFSLKPNETRTYKVLLNASYTGRFYLPLQAVEAMYDGTINAREKGQWVQVRKAGIETAGQ